MSKGKSGVTLLYNMHGCVGMFGFCFFLVMVLGDKMDGLSYKVSGCSNIVLSC